MITKQEIIKVQENWGDGIIKIGSLLNDRKVCEKETDLLIDTLYAFELGVVLFKPTKAADNQFRLTRDGARSYFIGGNGDYPEDHGFALQPWTNVRFVNAATILEENRALAMGNYYFTDKVGNEVKVEFTFGYIKDQNGNLKIDLHHSSLPYK